jgi:hypothetical protein
MAFKGTDALFEVKEYSHKKLQRQKRPWEERFARVSFKTVKGLVPQGVKRMYTNSTCRKHHCETIRQIRDEVSTV